MLTEIRRANKWNATAMAAVAVAAGIAVWAGAHQRNVIGDVDNPDHPGNTKAHWTAQAGDSLPTVLCRWQAQTNATSHRLLLTDSMMHMTITKAIDQKGTMDHGLNALRDALPDGLPDLTIGGAWRDGTIGLMGTAPGTPPEEVLFRPCP